MMEGKNKAPGKTSNRLLFSLLLATFALISLVAATVAWFTIADFTKVYSMSMEITSGTNLRFDLDPHDTFEEYVKTLSFRQIADRIRQEKRTDIGTTALEPVTTRDYSVFFYEDGSVVPSDKGAYIEFTLHFMATESMLIHLTSAGTEDGAGTEVTSSNAALPKAMRISFTADGKTYIYDPGMGDESQEKGNNKTLGLPEARKMSPNKNNQMFWLEKDQDKPVIVRIWLEGTDEACTDALRKADYAISLRFVGTDENHNILDGTRRD